jgi:hypothetical protein
MTGANLKEMVNHRNRGSFVVLRMILAAMVGATLAWTAALPWLPYAPLASHKIEDHYSFGTTFGWLSSMLTGAFVCGPLTYLMRRSNSEPRLATLFAGISACLGALALVLADSFGDVVARRLELSGVDDLLGRLIASLACAIAVVGAVLLTCGISPRNIQAMLAVICSAVATLVATYALAPVELLVTVITTDPHVTPTTNAWALYAPSFLVESVASAIVAAYFLALYQHRQLVFHGHSSSEGRHDGTSEGRTAQEPPKRAPWYVTLPGGAITYLKNGSNIVGRAPECEVHLIDNAVSSIHCEIIIEDAAAGIRDLGSLNGTLVDGYPIRGAKALASGSQIFVGASLLYLWHTPDRDSVFLSLLPAVRE